MGTRFLIVAALLVAHTTSAMTNQDAYPGLRRRPSKISAAIGAASSNSYDENYLSQILNFIEEQARRKFQEKLRSNPKPRLDEDDDNDMDRPFDFSMKPLSGKVPTIDESYEFGVAPNDPRFYDDNTMREPSAAKFSGYEDGTNDNSMNGLERSSNEAAGSYARIKDPLVVNPKPNPNANYKSIEMPGQLHKWGRNNNNNNAAMGLQPGQDMVVQRPVNLEAQSPISIYAVALIAGVSAAITICLIALGIGWWTFYKKSKAAQNVEYPAYGITGPNKEKLSPTSGDRRLAQNAQIYHYQHQKQQIIAMENKMGDDRHGSLSDAANSEDEEGDYTVYECPGLGLAHTGGEIEVKNPFFFEESTPAATTPGNVQQAKAQPTTQAASAPPAPQSKSTTKEEGEKKKVSGEGEKKNGKSGKSGKQ